MAEKISTERVVRGYYVTIDFGIGDEEFYVEEQYMQGLQCGFTITQDGNDIKDQELIDKIARAVEKFEEEN